MNLGEKIKQRRLELNLTLEDVGKLVGASKSTVMKWETGYIENMKRDKIALLAKALNVSPLWVMGLTDLKSNLTSTKAIPLLGTIAAGIPSLAEENIEEYFNINASLKADFALRIKGNSMISAGIFTNDIVFIRQQCDLENGEIGAVLIDNTATLKKFYRANGAIILQAENDDFEPLVRF